MVLSKVFNSLWNNLYAFGQNFIAENDQILKTQSIIWSHCTKGTSNCDITVHRTVSSQYLLLQYHSTSYCDVSTSYCDVTIRPNVTSQYILMWRHSWLAYFSEQTGFRWRIIDKEDDPTRPMICTSKSFNFKVNIFVRKTVDFEQMPMWGEWQLSGDEGSYLPKW